MPNTSGAADIGGDGAGEIPAISGIEAEIRVGIVKAPGPSRVKGSRILRENRLF